MSNSLPRIMVFVDGTNFLVRLSEELKIPFRADKPPTSTFRYAQRQIKYLCDGDPTIRWFWFASYQGSDEYRNKLRSKLRECEFEPVLFQKRSGREKGVDIALTKEMLVNAFNQNFDIGFLIAGDEDYVGLVNEVKRYGPIVRGAFFEHGLSEELRLACDSFIYMNRSTFSGMNYEQLCETIREEAKQGL